MKKCDKLANNKNSGKKFRNFNSPSSSHQFSLIMKVGDDLRAWLVVHGAENFDRIIIDKDPKYDGYSLFYQQQEEEETATTPLFGIPKKCCIHDEVAYARLSPHLDAACRPFQQGKSMITLFMCLERRPELYWKAPFCVDGSTRIKESFYKAYFDAIMPEHGMDDPYQWGADKEEEDGDDLNEKEVERLLYPTNLYHGYKQRLASFREEWKSVIKMLDSKQSRFSWAELIPFRDWIFCKSILYSRAFSSTIIAESFSGGKRKEREETFSVIEQLMDASESFRSGYKPSGLLVIPGADMTNHCPGIKVDWKFDQKSQTIGYHRSGDTGTDSTGGLLPVLNNYGSKSNEDLLHGYGFTIADNPHDYYVMKINLSRDPNVRMKMHLLEQFGLVPQLLKHDYDNDDDNNSVVIFFFRRDFDDSDKSPIHDAIWYKVMSILLLNEMECHLIRYLGEEKKVNVEACLTFPLSDRIHRTVLQTTLERFETCLTNLETFYPFSSGCGDGPREIHVRNYWQGLFGICNRVIGMLGDRIEGLEGSDLVVGGIPRLWFEHSSDNAILPFEPFQEAWKASCELATQDDQVDGACDIATSTLLSISSANDSECSSIHWLDQLDTKWLPGLDPEQEEDLTEAAKEILLNSSEEDECEGEEFDPSFHRLLCNLIQVMELM